MVSVSVPTYSAVQVMAAEARSCGVRFVTADELGAAARSGNSSVGAGVPNTDRAAWDLSVFDVVVDGILGTGTSSNPALRGTARAVGEEMTRVAPTGQARVQQVIDATQLPLPRR